MLKRTPLKSKSSLKKSKIKSKGKKTNAWDAIRKELVDKFQALGIMSCELKYENCTGSLFCAFAHSKKRRDIVGAELYEVILACSSCHEKIEYSGKENMYNVVKEVIRNRGS